MNSGEAMSDFFFFLDFFLFLMFCIGYELLLLFKPVAFYTIIDADTPLGRCTCIVLQGFCYRSIFLYLCDGLISVVI